MAQQSAIGVGMIGYGTVGRGVARLLHEQAPTYAKLLGRPIELKKVLVRDLAKARQSGQAPPDLITNDADTFFATPDISIVVEVAGGLEVISQYVRRALEQGRHVVTANKALLAAEGPDLFARARAGGVCIAFEASCAGGIPVITALKFGLMANRIQGLYGILNGTCNFILTAMTQQGQSYDAALALAQEKGYAEADPALDVGGQDAAQKLAILASLAFAVRATGDQVWCEGIDRLQLADIKFGAEMGYDIKLLAIAERIDGQISLRVHPCFIHADEPLAQVHGPFNALSVYGHATGHTMYFGRGAGQMPTASAVVSDLLNVASGWYAQAVSHLRLLPDQHEPVKLMDPADLRCRYYLRMDARDVPGVVAKVAKILGDLDISISGVMQHEVEPGEFVPLVIMTHAARQGAIDQARQKIEALAVIDGPPVLIRIVDLPES